MAVSVRRTNPGDEAWIKALVIERWGAEFVVARGRVYRPAELPGFLAVAEDGSRLGLLTYSRHDGACEIVTLDSLREGEGVGTALVEAVIAEARRGGSSRLWLITTNDNLRALGFYQKRGFFLAALHANALERSRTLKPSIPLVSEEGIPLRDEIELEIPLSMDGSEEGEPYEKG